MISLTFIFYIYIIYILRGGFETERFGAFSLLQGECPCSVPAFLIIDKLKKNQEVLSLTTQEIAGKKKFLHDKS